MGVFSSLESEHELAGMGWEGKGHLESPATALQKQRLVKELQHLGWGLCNLDQWWFVPVGWSQREIIRMERGNGQRGHQI